jgi:hypothetical protein
VAITLANLAVVAGLLWLLAIFVARLREPRVRIVAAKGTEPDQPDLDLSTTVVRELALVRNGGRPALAVIEAVDREVEIPAGLVPARSGGFDLFSWLGTFLIRTYRLEIRYEEDDPTDLTAVVRLYSPLLRLLGSDVIKESSFAVLRREPGKPPYPPAATNPAPTAGSQPASVLTQGESIKERKRRLGIAVASWAIYQWLLGRSRDRIALLTPDWRSYALFRLGVEWWGLNSREHARRAYKEALSVDPFNRGALFNLGIVEATRGCHAAALALFEATRAETERVSRGIPGARSTDPLWYRAVYNSAAVVHHDRLATADVPPECQVPDGDAAYGNARERLQMSIDSGRLVLLAIERRHGSPTWSGFQWLATFLRMTQAASVVLLATMARAEDT